MQFFTERGISWCLLDNKYGDPVVSVWNDSGHQESWILPREYQADCVRHWVLSRFNTPG